MGLYEKRRTLYRNVALKILNILEFTLHTRQVQEVQDAIVSPLQQQTGTSHGILHTLT